MGDRYAGERYTPQFPSCGLWRLRFNGHALYFFGSRTYSYPAVSGKPTTAGSFDYSPARQAMPNEGPIPEGSYWVRPDEMDDNWHYWFSSAAWNGWGRYRISIHPYPATVTHGRGGFFIHGGATAGSAGCIDLVNHMNDFHDDFVREVGSRQCYIPLEVSYNGPGDYPLPRGNTRAT
jgi:hypothetical protein